MGGEVFSLTHIPIIINIVFCFQVRWLNGDGNEVVDLHDESIRFMGELPHPPDAVMSRSEAILLSDRQRSNKDLDRKLKLIRQDRAIQRQIDESGDSMDNSIGENADRSSVPKSERKSAKKVTRDQAHVLCTSVILILGIWHCMQESIIVNLDGNHDEWSFFARHWRTTEGRLKVLLSCGSVNDALKELFSCVAGISKWFVQRFRAANPYCDIIDYTRVDEFIDTEARQSKVFARLRSLLESTILTKVLHDSMRQGMLSNVCLLLRQLSKLCAALNKFKYSRLLPQFEVLIVTMPLQDLAVVLDVMFADLGAYFAPTDELTEVLIFCIGNWLVVIPVIRRGSKGLKGLRVYSVELNLVDLLELELVQSASRLET